MYIHLDYHDITSFKQKEERKRILLADSNLFLKRDSEPILSMAIVKVEAGHLDKEGFKGPKYSLLKLAFDRNYYQYKIVSSEVRNLENTFSWTIGIIWRWLNSHINDNTKIYPVFMYSRRLLDTKYHTQNFLETLRLPFMISLPDISTNINLPMQNTDGRYLASVEDTYVQLFLQTLLNENQPFPINHALIQKIKESRPQDSSW